MSEIKDCSFPENGLEVVVEIKNLAHVANAQTQVLSIARKLCFSEIDAHKAATSASELASNLVHHTLIGGTIRIRELRKEGYVGIEIVSNDSGPGIMDVEQVLQDGYSTGPGLGSGLPSIRRMMDELEISVIDNTNTCITTRLWCPCE
ncbi:anti-sigma regulatory factor [Methanolobus vulcani]|uniref:Anti-sigma regulatory factor n=1 Tax=Methanolobus vulcani TaxID=38026 RepID=A0A7Z8KME9_9EURY|nr:anti-sigma regulatory factor [Methanolobus vulcani]TQD24880.1 anti-sigma regulatory factor [Methanolobus vulcani]